MLRPVATRVFAATAVAIFHAQGGNHHGIAAGQVTLVRGRLQSNCRRREGQGFARSDPWTMLTPRLATMCGAAFEMTHAEALETLRKHASERAIKAGSYGKFLLTASSVEGDHSTPNAEKIARIAALELLCHTYFHSTKGQEAVWVVSILSNYTTWPHLQLAGKTVADILANLDVSGTEKFSVTNRRNIDGGLYLEVMPTGSKLWRMKFRQANGKESRLAIGIYPETTLVQARNKRDEARKLKSNGIDPGQEVAKAYNSRPHRHTHQDRLVMDEFRNAFPTAASSETLLMRLYSS